MRLAIACVLVLAVVAYAALSGLWVTNSSGWYLSLVQPPWQPPNWIFGVIWPYNFVMLGYVSVRFANAAPLAEMWVWTVTLIVTVTTAILWSYTFYQVKNLGLAAAFLAITASATLVLSVLIFRFDSVLGLFFVPYQLWLITAASLAVGYWRLNPS
jgi:tryptophan-rich sensory protein